MPEPPRQLRAFVALAPPPEWTPVLHQIQAGLAALLRGPQVRWTPPAQIHLTLSFLGNISPAHVSEAGARLQTACHGVNPFDLELGDLGCFPDRRRPRIFWVGLRGDVESLLTLQNAVSLSLASVGDHEETKPFTPHLTLGRANPAHRRPPCDIQDPPFHRPGPWRVVSVQLMRSELTSGGARYSLLFDHVLGQNLPRAPHE